MLEIIFFYINFSILIFKGNLVIIYYRLSFYFEGRGFFERRQICLIRAFVSCKITQMKPSSAFVKNETIRERSNLLYPIFSYYRRILGMGMGILL